MPVRISKNRVALENIPLNEALGTSIASASTINLTTATGNTVHITGTTAISAVTLGAGMIRDVIFDGILTLTHHTTTNNLPGGANITTAVNDRARYISDGTTVYCVNYQKADGTAVVGISSKVVNTSYDVSVTGTLAITGAGFTPRAAHILVTIGGTVAASWGVLDSNGTGGCTFNRHADGADTLASSANCIHLVPAAGTTATCAWASWDADGMTLTRVKTGAPTGTADLRILFIK